MRGSRLTYRQMTHIREEYPDLDFPGILSLTEAQIAARVDRGELDEYRLIHMLDDIDRLEAEAEWMDGS